MKGTRAVLRRGASTLVLVVAGLAATAPEALTQERPGRPDIPLPTLVTPRGWLGIEFQWDEPAGREGPVMVVRQVMPGSPAERAQLLPGDRVRRFGGVAPDPVSAQARLARVQPGDTITLEVVRPPEGRARQVTIRAGERPAVVVLGAGGEWVSFPPDTLQVRLRINIDSIRTEMDRQLRQAEDRVVMVRLLTEEAAREREGILRTWEADSRVLSEALRRSHAALHEVQVRTLAGWDTIWAGGARGQGQIRVRGTASPGAVGRPWPGEEGGLVVLRTGQRVVAGAEVTPLNPDLARYFGTDSGVLTVEVLDDTPAARGGLLGGDVIIRVGDETVANVAQLRTTLERGYRSPPVPVTVIREGREVQLLLPR